ncbi:unnamed protein product [Arabis nemorensis]|uniref:DUF1204 domain-containing protein n=1 Tax=Arabis nemorensis TaxID=586526 RepID=A0A565C4A7_9BRAS|nr:unnamed protein product [Arabis nemorensis]
MSLFPPILTAPKPGERTLIPLLKKLQPQLWPEFLEQRIQRCQERITTGCYTLDLVPLRPYTFPPIKPHKPRQKKAGEEMVKAKFKRVNNTDVAQESPVPGKRTDAAVKQAGPSIATQGVSKQIPSQTEKTAEASLAAKNGKAGDRKKIPTGVAAEGSKKKQRVEESAQKNASVESAATGSGEEPMTYDLSFRFKSKDYITSISQACAELCSKILCSTEHNFPKPDDLIEAEAYQLFSGSVMEMITHGNLIIEKYEHRSRGLLKKLEEYPSVKKEAKKVPGLEKKVTAQITLMDDLSKKAQEARQRAKFTEQELERVKAEKESLQYFPDQETARLRSSRRHEVVQIIAKCDAKLSRIRKSVADNEEANRLNALMNQAMAIKDYLAGFKKVGADVLDERFKELDEKFERFEKDFDALDVEEITESDFKMTPPP